MKFSKHLFVFLTFAVLITGCYQEENWLEDNWEKDENYYPNISNVSILAEQETYAEGDAVNLDLRFWSEGSVESIQLLHEYGGNNQEVYSEYAYSEAGYSEITKTDSIVVEYTVPQGSSGSTISLEFEVANENGLSASNTNATDAAIRDISIEVE